MLRKNPQPSFDRGFFYVWADKLGTLREEDGEPRVWGKRFGNLTGTEAFGRAGHAGGMKYPCVKRVSLSRAASCTRGTQGIAEDEPRPSCP